MPAKPTIAFVTTCKGRLHHVRETLPLIAQQAPDEIIVVDYGCPDRVGDWVTANVPQARVVRVDDDPGFSVARARNLGAAQARADWIVFSDADARVAPGFVDWIRANADARCFFRPRQVRGEEAWTLEGTMACPRAAFAAIGGYDEAISGWGGEDQDLYALLRFHGLHEDRYPTAFVESIPHGDEDRVRFHTVKDRRFNQTVNRFYMEAKHLWMSVRQLRTQPPMPTRLHLLAEVRSQMARWRDSGATEPVAITLKAENFVRMPGRNRLRTEAAFRLTLEPGPPPRGPRQDGNR